MAATHIFTVDSDQHKIINSAGRATDFPLHLFQRSNDSFVVTVQVDGEIYTLNATYTYRLTLKDGGVLDAITLLVNHTADDIDIPTGVLTFTDVSFTTVELDAYCGDDAMPELSPYMEITEVDTGNNIVAKFMAQLVYLQPTGFTAGEGNPTNATPAGNLNDLADVNAGSPVNQDMLTWDSATSKWIPWQPTVESANGTFDFTGGDTADLDITLSGPYTQVEISSLQLHIVDALESDAEEWGFLFAFDSASRRGEAVTFRYYNVYLAQTTLDGEHLAGSTSLLLSDSSPYFWDELSKFIDSPEEFCRRDSDGGDFDLWSPTLEDHADGDHLSMVDEPPVYWESWGTTLPNDDGDNKLRLRLRLGNLIDYSIECKIKYTITARA